MQKRHRLKRAARKVQRVAVEIKEFVLVSAGIALIAAACCMIALTIRAWPLLLSIKLGTQQTTATMKSAQGTADGINQSLPGLKADIDQAGSVLKSAQAQVQAMGEQTAKIGKLADHLSIFVNDTNLRVNDELLPNISHTARSLGQTADAATATLNEGSQTLAQFRLTYADNEHIRSLLASYDATGKNIQGITDHGEKVVEDLQVASDYGREEIEKLKRPKTKAKIIGGAVLGFSLKVAIETLAQVISGN